MHRLLVSFLLLLLLNGGGRDAFADDKLAGALLFHAPFDRTADAGLAKGDPKIYTAETIKREKLTAGLKTDAASVQLAGGKFGGGLRFSKKSKQVVLFRGAGNLKYRKNGFQGTISFWMRLNPNEDLPAGYVDPLQITDKKWNDASFFVDFTKENPRQFRLGVFSDFAHWNPMNRKWNDVPEGERPLVTVKKPPFSRDRWTHVAITFRDFNSKKKPGEAVLYLDAKPQGRLKGRQQFTWSPQKVAIMLGINYVGGIDDLAIFDRALTAADIRTLHQLPRGVGSLRAGVAER